ncbi:hypothetical protein BUALT_Bualt07G0050300 [Buddleja alternifolia]|uniref:Glutathione hydrolase n=1 Tax=Buddleja alternifolia TaxID=168488 RepID=A0AAV6XJ05_9LAMI|nr:hypothetical protein BUALT_Bualt07G0050300 [Buddleja alternifolia]
MRAKQASPSFWSKELSTGISWNVYAAPRARSERMKCSEESLPQGIEGEGIYRLRISSLGSSTGGQIQVASALTGFIMRRDSATMKNLLFSVCSASGQGFPILFLSLVFLALSPKTADGAVRGERIIARNGVVATDETKCSKIGRDMLVQGGHAVDAAVAATLCLGVISPAYSGLGGGGFMLVRSAEGDAKVFDMREMAPGRAFKVRLLSLHSPWESLVKTSENLARKGSDEDFDETLRLRKLADTLAAIARRGMDVFYNGSIAQSLAREIQKEGGIITKEDFQKYRVIMRKPLVADVWGYNMVTAPPPASGGAMIILILKILSNYKANGVPTPLRIHRAVEALKYALALRTNLGDPEFVNVTKVVADMISTSFAEKVKNWINDNTTFNPSHYGSKRSQVYDHGTTHICVVDSRRNVVTLTTSLNNHYGSGLVSQSTGIYLNNQMCDFSLPTSSIPPPSPANLIQPYKRPLSSMAPAIFLEGGKVKAVIGAAGGLLIPDAVSQVLNNHLNLKMDPYDAVKAPRFYHTVKLRTIHQYLSTRHIWSNRMHSSVRDEANPSSYCSKGPCEQCHLIIYQIAIYIMQLYPNVLYLENFTSRKGERYRYSRYIMKELRKKGHILQNASYGTVCQFEIQRVKGPNAGELVAVSDPRKGGYPSGY